MVDQLQVMSGGTHELKGKSVEVKTAAPRDGPRQFNGGGGGFNGGGYGGGGYGGGGYGGQQGWSQQVRLALQYGALFGGIATNSSHLSRKLFLGKTDCSPSIIRV